MFWLACRVQFYPTVQFFYSVTNTSSPAPYSLVQFSPEDQIMIEFMWPAGTLKKVGMSRFVNASEEKTMFNGVPHPSTNSGGLFVLNRRSPTISGLPRRILAKFWFISTLSRTRISCSIAVPFRSSSRLTPTRHSCNIHFVIGNGRGSGSLLKNAPISPTKKNSVSTIRRNRLLFIICLFQAVAPWPNFHYKYFL